MVLRAALLLSCALGALALDNGLSDKPAMGFSTWNAFRQYIDEVTIKRMADLMVEMGFFDAGYTYLNVDDGWAAKERVNGRLAANTTLFPSGMKALGDYIHSKGLKFGLYADAGHRTCLELPGSLGYEEVDAQTFAEWGVDYLKYDNCGASTEEWVVDRYTAMRDALNKTGRPILYSVANWGVVEPWLWAQGVGNSWRTTEEIEPWWDGFIKVIDYNTGLSQFAGPGRGWNDMDTLYVGNHGLTFYNDMHAEHSAHETRTHFALWALMKSPLMIGHDLRRLNETAHTVLKSQEVIAINQDALGVPGDLIWQQGQKKIYAAPLAGSSRAVVLANMQTTQSQYPLSNITVFWDQLGLPMAAEAMVRDLYAEEDLGVCVGSFSASVRVHDVAVLRITPLDPTVADDSWRPWHAQPMYAPQPANVVPLSAADWAGVHSGLSASSFRSTVPGFAMALSVFVALAAVCVVGYFVVLQRRLRGWQQLQDGTNGAELARTQPGWRKESDV